MPMLTTVVMRSPVAPVHSPLRSRSVKSPMLVQHRVHVLDDVLTVDHQLHACRVAQRGVQHRTVLRRVDVHAGEHRVTALLQPGSAGQVDQQLQRLAGDPVLAVVDVEVADRQRQLGAALGVFGKQLAEVFLTDLVVMSLQGLPGGSGCDIGDLLRIGGHVLDPSAAG